MKSIKPSQKRKPNRSTLGIVLAVFLFSGGVGEAAYDVDIGPLTFRVGVGDVVWVSDCDTEYTGQIDVPSQIDIGNKFAPVSSIGSEAFKYSKASAVTLPQSVTAIGQGAFQYSDIKSINIPDSITVIKFETFQGCDQLESIVLPEGMTTIELKAFEGCDQLKSVTLPQSLSTIEREVFQNSGVESISIPDSITIINERTFKDCVQLQTVTLSSNLMYLREGAFSGCESLGSITIPGSLSDWWSLESGIFFGCQSLTSVVIEDGVKKISENAFAYCTSLTNVTIPESVTKIEHSAFSVATSLEEIRIPPSVTSLGWNVFFYTGLKHIVLPESVQEIGLGVFQSCSSLETASIGKGISIIPERTFKDCSNLQRVASTNSLVVVGEEAFMNCENMASIAIPGSVQTIRENAFSGCSALTDLLFQENFRNVWDGAFSNCANLTSCVFLGSPPNWSSSDPFAQTPNVTVYGIEGKGFTTPEWQGVPCKILVPLSESSIGRAVIVRGTVSVVRGGMTKTIVTGAEIKVGDTVVTGTRSFVRVALKDSNINLGPKSRYIVEKELLEGQPDPSIFQTILNVIEGQISIYKDSSSGSLIIKTPTAAFGVRGTTLDVDVSQEGGMVRTVVEVLEGVVDYEDNTTGETGEIRTGETFSNEDVAISTSSGSSSRLSLLLQKKLKKLKKKLKSAKRARKVAKVKRYKDQIKKPKKQLRSA